MTELLAADGEKPTYIHKCLPKMCSEAAVDMSILQGWGRQIKEAETGGAQLCDMLQSGCLSLAVMPDITFAVSLT